MIACGLASCFSFLRLFDGLWARLLVFVLGVALGLGAHLQLFDRLEGRDDTDAEMVERFSGTHRAEVPKLHTRSLLTVLFA